MFSGWAFSSSFISVYFVSIPNSLLSILAALSLSLVLLHDPHTLVRCALPRMEEVARRHEAPLKHSRDTRAGTFNTSSFKTDQDLLTRIRSLLVARNEQYPPKTPPPSPDHSFSPSNIYDRTAGYFPENAGVITFNSVKTIAKLAHAKARESSMVSTTFDGPAGQLEDPYTDGVRRHPSHPNMHRERSSSMDQTASQASSGLNQRVLGGHIGRDYRTVVDSTMTPISPTAALPQKALQKARHDSQVPAFVLRTVRPATPQLTEKRLRPGPQHVPGSYMSEIDRSIDPRSVVAAPSGSEYGSMPEDSSALAPQLYHGSHAVLPHGAVNALIKTISLDPAAPANRSVRSMLSRPSLRERLSNGTLSSRTSVKQAHHLLLKPSADQFTPSMPIEPLLTSGIDHMHEHDVSEAPLNGSAGRQSGERPGELEPESKKLKNQIVHPQNAGLRESNETFLAPNGPPLCEILTDLSPLGQEVSHESVVDSVARASLVSCKRASLGGSLDLERTSVLTQQPPAMEELEAPEHSDNRGHDPTGRRGGSPPRFVAEVASTGSNSISVLSGNPSQGKVRESLEHKSVRRNHFVNDANGLPKSPSLLSSGGSVTTNENVDKQGLSREHQLLHEKPYQVQSDNREAQDTQQPKLGEYLLNRLLGRHTTLPEARDLTNLTARPYHRQRNVPDAIHRDRNSPDYAPPLRQQTVDDESFNQVIRDLEALLQEAILIARQGVDRDQSVPTRQSLTRYSRSDRSSMASSSPYEEDNQNPVDLGQDQPGRKHIIIVEREEVETDPDRFKETREATPEPIGSVVATQHSLMSPGYDVDEPRIGGGPALEFTFPESQQSPQLRHPSYMPQFQHIVPSSSDAALQTESIDRAAGKDSVRVSNAGAVMSELLVAPLKPSPLQALRTEQFVHLLRESKIPPTVRSSVDIQAASHTPGDHSPLHQSPAIQPRSQSAMLQTTNFASDTVIPSHVVSNQLVERACNRKAGSFDWRNPSLQTPMVTNTPVAGEQHDQPIPLSDMGPPRQDTIASMHAAEPQTHDQETTPDKKSYSLSNRHHFSIREQHGFSLSRSHRRAPIARDWSTPRKRFVAAVACVNTALLGLIVGIYAGEVPAIQYAIVDEHHYTIQGNVVLYAGLAIPTALLWPLPLLYGRKPFILAALALLIPLQFPQAIVVSTTRSPDVATYRTGLLVARAISGLVMGFANINFLATLLDLFGASLQSGNPHQEVVNENDVRRHGGGMGVWLGIWAWCFIGSIGVGFLFGALVISGVNVSWGFYISVVLIAVVLLLNIITPEVRRSPYRRSMAEVRTGSDISRRIARGEVKMHLQSTGPKWWWEEVIAGNVLCLRLLKEPGFLLLALYLGWIYGQVILVISVSDIIIFRRAPLRLIASGRFNLQIL